MAKRKIRNLVVILGDQLDKNLSALDDFDADLDRIWMAEVAAESKFVWSHKIRIVMFLSAMRHFRDYLENKCEFPVFYRKLDDAKNKGDLASELEDAINSWKPDRIVFTQPGAWRVQQLVTDVAHDNQVELELRPDRHFICSIEEFEEHAADRKQLRLEFFYRELRKRHDILMENSKPTGGKWNYDAENRKSFSKSGPEKIAKIISFKPDKITTKVIQLVQANFADHPGDLDTFDWPVTHADSKKALRHFIKHGLPEFGKYQDAMWTDQPFLNHSRLSAAMNLKLLDPRDVIQAAVDAFDADDAPLSSVEGFVRQILGWREYVRGIYWTSMPDYLERNEMKAKQDLPEFFWTGETEMKCLSQVIGQTLKFGYAHHIQRLMVTGLFCLMLGVDPKQVHSWYLAVYLDAVEWVELPNTLGMSQYADGGVMASKPYIATGKYIQRMSNYCGECKFNPANATGDDACPFTTLYWDYLARHKKKLAANNRMSLQVKNLDRKSEAELKKIKTQAKKLRKQLA